MRRIPVLAAAFGVPVFCVAPTHAAVVVDDGDAGYATVGTWAESGTNPANEFNGDSDFNNTNAAGQTASYAAGLPSGGVWSVEYYIPDTAAVNVPYTVTSAAGSQTVQADQNINQQQFVSLGYYNFDAGPSYSVTVDASNTSSVIRADAIRWSQAGVDPAVDFVTDSNSQGVTGGFYAENAGSWITSGSSSELYDAGDRLSQSNGATATFTTLPIALANYELFVSWEEETNRETNALVRVTDSDGGVTDLRVNQTLAPTGGGTFNDARWQSLGVYSFDAGSSVQLIKDDGDSQYLVADGLRLSYVSAIPEPASLALVGIGALMLVGRPRR